jgi:hypothetical protein
MLESLDENYFFKEFVPLFSLAILILSRGGPSLLLRRRRLRYHSRAVSRREEKNLLEAILK